MILAYIISNSAEEAEEIALTLMEKRLVYSINILPEVRSYQREGDKVLKHTRTIVLAKTKSLLYTRIEEVVDEIQKTGTAIVFSMPFSQMSQKLFDNIQVNTLKT
ncbi:MAG: divalent cation tolerance protein CutA [Bacteroides sp.]|nr:divalent cation tolerance protein CutA [Bacteroides sp.]